MLVLDLCIKGTTIEERPLHPCNGCLRTRLCRPKTWGSRSRCSWRVFFFQWRDFPSNVSPGILILYRDKTGVVTLRFFQGIIIICWGHWHMAILGLFFRIWVYWILVCSPPLEELMLWLFHVRARGLQIGCSVVRRQERVSNFSHLHTLLCCSYTSMGVSGSWLRQKPFIYLFIYRVQYDFQRCQRRQDGSKVGWQWYPIFCGVWKIMFILDMEPTKFGDRNQLGHLLQGLNWAYRRYCSLWSIVTPKGIEP